jgi:anti-sigma factor ChrR (cupin superfamily)
MTTAITWHHVDSLSSKELYPGVFRKTVHSQEDGFKILLVEIGAGRKFLELDVHEPGPEEVYVLEGVFNDGERDYPAGSFVHNPKGSAHVPQSKDGCKILVIFPRG